jgi:hypothetical protein
VPDYTAHNDREIPRAEEPVSAEEIEGTDSTDEARHAEGTDRAQLDPSLGSLS